jgi:hypothetical protein
MNTVAEPVKKKKRDMLYQAFLKFPSMIKGSGYKSDSSTASTASSPSSVGSYENGNPSRSPNSFAHV